MRSVDETDCKLSTSNGTVSMSTSKIKNIFLLTLDFASESSHLEGNHFKLGHSRIEWQLTSNETCGTLFDMVVCCWRFITTMVL